MEACLRILCRGKRHRQCSQSQEDFPALTFCRDGGTIYLRILQDPGPIPETGYNAFKITIRKLDFYFRVEENIPYSSIGTEGRGDR